MIVWSSNNKSAEGMVAFVLAHVTAASLLNRDGRGFLQLVTAGVVGSVVEGYSTDIDNLEIALAAYACY